MTREPYSPKLATNLWVGHTKSIHPALPTLVEIPETRF
jgi:hypothetical protein